MSEPCPRPPGCVVAHGCHRCGAYRGKPCRPDVRAVAIARAFHEAYEDLAPRFAYETREASAVPWDEVPEPNRSLMVAVAQELMDDAVIIAVPK